jgi:hypothetical protein
MVSDCIRIILRLLVLCLPALAQSDWQRVTALSPNTKIEVRTTGGDSHKGLLSRATPSELALSERSQPVSIAQPDVARVKSLSRSHRLRNLLIGAAIGVAGGVILDRTAGERFRNEGQSVTASLYAASIGLGAGIGVSFASHPVIYHK